jgi:hypothetical protein
MRTRDLSINFEEVHTLALLSSFDQSAPSRQLTQGGCYLSFLSFSLPAFLLAGSFLHVCADG